VRGALGQVHKLLGIEQKLRQYEVGEKFVRGVVDLAGFSAIDHAWRSSENLPTTEELDQPDAWLLRVDRTAVAG
jgi:uncharacterized protein (DUF2342 family)